MKKLFFALMILSAFWVMPGCGDDGAGGNNCDNAASDLTDAANAFAADPTGETCQDYIDAVSDALNACDGVGGWDAVRDEWQDFLDSDPCAGF